MVLVGLMGRQFHPAHTIGHVEGHYRHCALTKVEYDRKTEQQDLQLDSGHL